MTARQIEELAYDMVEAYRECKTIDLMCAYVRLTYHDADVKILDAMARAICAYCEVNLEKTIE